jgi:ABC-type Fe3+ transport system substrate-binding protein
VRSCRYTGGGVLASSKHKEQALQFLKFVTGKDGQAVLRDGTSFEYAIGVGEAANPALTPLADLQAPNDRPRPARQRQGDAVDDGRRPALGRMRKRC